MSRNYERMTLHEAVAKSELVRSEEDSRLLRNYLISEIITHGIPVPHVPESIEFKIQATTYLIDIDQAKEVTTFLLPRAQHREQPISANQMMKLGLAVQDLIILGKEKDTGITHPIKISKAYGSKFVDAYCDYVQRYIDKRNELITWIWERDYLHPTPDTGSDEVVSFLQVYDWLFGKPADNRLRVIKL